MNLKFQSYIYRFIFPVNSFQNRRIVKHYSFYIQLKRSQLRSMLIFLYPLETSENYRLLMFPGGTKANTEPKWVKRQQYLQESHNLMFLAWNASISIVKHNDCKNKTTWLNQTAFYKFSLYLIQLTLKTLNKFLKNYFFIWKLFYFKRFSNEIVFKLSKNVELTTVNDPNIGYHVEWKI